MTPVFESPSLWSSASSASQTANPEVLVITSEIPWPLNTGGHIRSFHILKALSEQFNVRVIAGVELTVDPGLQALGRNGIRVVPAFQNSRNRLNELGRVAWSAVREEPYVMFNRHNRPAMRREIQKQLAESSPDVVYLDPLAFRGLFPKARIIADLHNVYSTVAKRVASERKFPVNLFLHNEARLLGYMEKQLARGRASSCRFPIRSGTTFRSSAVELFDSYPTAWTVPHSTSIRSDGSTITQRCCTWVRCPGSRMRKQRSLWLDK